MMTMNMREEEDVRGFASEQCSRLCGDPCTLAVFGLIRKFRGLRNVDWALQGSLAEVVEAVRIVHLEEWAVDFLREVVLGYHHTLNMAILVISCTYPFGFHEIGRNRCS